ncbi:hypothetical protein HWV00_00725 [Moritella sp. 24]|uniref:hypothetical protein n=1 Tax=Moritella sp. 24 TaxID=2746230 RepID=UPI001BAE3B87|nr:hypothetical protein [Moritella sp. 24]QUM74897.1 hypothetical protein HWV00_00725 [Moritella sp. 24]
MKLNLISKALLVALSATSLVACNSDSSNDNTGQQPVADLQFSFGLENTKEIANNNNIPMPNDLYFIGEDGSTRNSNIIIFGCGSAESGPNNDGNEDPENIENATKCSLEDLDGWSTTAPFTLPMSGDVDQLDISTFAKSIHIFEKRSVPIPGYSELKYDEDFTVRVTKFNHLQILPLKPLSPNTQHILAITKDLASTSGDIVKPADSFNILLQDDTPESPYKEAVNSLFTKLDNEKITTKTVLYIAGIKTQSIGEILTNLAQNPDADVAGIKSSDIPEEHLVGAGLPPAVLDGIVGGIVGGIIGVPDVDPNFCESSIGDGLFVECVRKLQAAVTLPYYLDDSTAITSANCKADTNNQDNAKFWFNIDGINVANNESYFESYRYTNTAEGCPSLHSSWTLTSGRTPKPDNQGVTQELAVQVVLPNPDRTPMPTNGWPVVIFSHGITAAKEFGNGGMLLLDNFVQAELANQGYAVLAIDHPLHNSRAVDLNDDGIYDINVSQSLRGLFPGHDEADVKNFLKADSLLTSRDNLRQSIADLINLRASITNGFTLTNPAIPSFDQLDNDNVYVMGHSMGSIAAASFSGIVEKTPTEIKGAILANPGAGIAGILMNSVWLGYSEVPPAIKALPEFRLRMAKELGLATDDSDETLAAVRAYAEQNPSEYKQTSDKISPEYFSEFQYLMQAVVDTVDPLNYTEALQDKPILSLTVAGSVSEQPALKDIQGGFLTTADQTVPIKVELDGQTTYEVCNKMSAGAVASQDMGCFNGSSAKPYYSLDNTEFPLSGAEPLETQLGLRNVLNSTDRSYTRFLTGTHNIGAGTLTGSETEGNADYASVDSAATELTIQAASFVEYSLGSDGEYVQGSNRVAPENLTIIEIEKQ